MLETKSIGIFQGDVAIQEALKKAFEELRKDPQLLDYCFAWLPNDELTAQDYGESTVAKAKKWFLSTEIFVTLDVRLDQTKLPSVVITLDSQNETDATLGDINYEPAEVNEDGSVTNLESVRHQESYTISLYAQGEVETLLFLHSITLFALYRYKKTLLEARGFEVSSLRVGQLARVPDLDKELVFGRPLGLTGYVRHYWPSAEGEQIEELVASMKGDGSGGGIRILGGGKTPEVAMPVDPAWFMEQDMLGVSNTPHAPTRVVFTSLQATVTNVSPTAVRVAALGDQITVEGTLLNMITSVTIGGVNVPFQLSGADIIVTPPSLFFNPGQLVLYYPSGAIDAGTITNIQPVIDSVTAVVPPGGTIVVTGTELDQVTINVIVDGDSVPYTATPTEVQATAPYRYFINQPVLLGCDGGTKQSAQTVSIAPPTIFDIESRFQSLAAGYNFSVGVKEDGTLWAWGDNSSGQLGQGDFDNRGVMTQIGSDSDWLKVKAGGGFMYALKSNGTLWGCGNNGHGVLGQGDQISRSTLVQIMTNVSDMSAGGAVGYVIKDDGTLWGCGLNASGAIGQGDTLQYWYTTFVQIGTDLWSAIKGGNIYAIGLKQSDNNVYAWGSNESGQLGLGDNTDRSTPTQVTFTQDIQSICAGNTGSHSMAVRADGTLLGWGANDQGQLGLGDTVNRNSPTLVGTSYQTVICGGAFTYAIQIGGSVWRWGQNGLGQLGTGDTQNLLVPTLMSPSPWTNIVCGAFHAFLGDSYGHYACGSNTDGQLGIEGPTAYTPTPIIWKVGTLSNGYLTDIKIEGLYLNLYNTVSVDYPPVTALPASIGPSQIVVNSQSIIDKWTTPKQLILTGINGVPSATTVRKVQIY